MAVVKGLIVTFILIILDFIFAGNKPIKIINLPHLYHNREKLFNMKFYLVENVNKSVLLSLKIFSRLLTFNYTDLSNWSIFPYSYISTEIKWKQVND